MKELLYNIYRETNIIYRKKEISTNNCVISYEHGARVEIIGDTLAEYRVEFINRDTNIIEYSTIIYNKSRFESGIKYYINWGIKVYENGELVAENNFDLKGQNVVIRIDSSALGDNIAWIPYVEEFRKKHECNVYVTTFYNDLFKGRYPKLKLGNPGTGFENVYAQYNLGWYYKLNNVIDFNKNRIDPKLYPLQETASIILGLEYKEIIPKVIYPNKVPNFYDKYVVIAPHGSAQAKYWNAVGGWQTVIDYLNSIGYKVILIGIERLGDPIHDFKLGGSLTNVIDKTGNIPIQDRVIDIKYASLFIGLGSGLSWLSWSLGTKTILISGFSEKNTEFSDCVRIGTTEKYSCSGCFNINRLMPGNFNWCPQHENTSRMFECTKTIKPETVITEINKILLP